MDVLAAKMGLSPLPRERGQVHVFGRRFFRPTRCPAEKWTSSHPGCERLIPRPSRPLTSPRRLPTIPWLHCSCERIEGGECHGDVRFGNDRVGDSRRGAASPCRSVGCRDIAVRREARPRVWSVARRVAPSPGGAAARRSTRAGFPTSILPRPASARPTGRWRPSRTTCRIAASRSRARQTGR